MSIEENTRTDEEVLALSVQSPRLFEVLVDRYQEAFLRKAQRILRSREEAEDVVQESFTKIYLNANRFRKQEGASFKSWAYRILLNTTFSHYQRLQRGGRASVPLEPEIMELFPDGQASMEQALLRDEVVSVLSRLPTHLARALRSFFLDDKPQQVIAEEEGVSVEVIKTRVLRAKREFKEYYAVDK